MLPSKSIVILAAVGIGAAVAYVSARKAGESLGAAVDYAGDMLYQISPLNNENVIYVGTNNAGAAITGDKNFTVGGAVYDVMHEPSSAWGYISTFTPAGQITYGVKRLWNWATE